MDKLKQPACEVVVDREEGEIIDVENYQNDLELESISSDEEADLRERIKELEAKNAELEKLAMVAVEQRRTVDYGDDVWSISSEEEYFQPKFSKLEAKMQHPKREVKTRPNRRSNNRYKSPERFKRISPEFKRRKHSVSPPRRERFKYVENYKRDHKKMHSKKRKRRYRSDSESMDGEIRDQLSYAIYKPNSMQNTGQTTKQENTLMKKLKLKSEPSNKENETTETNGVIDNDSSADEELIALRLNALKSKREVQEMIKDEPRNIAKGGETSMRNKELDSEELELRLLALKSAVVKKAENRKKHKQKQAYSPTDGILHLPTTSTSDNELINVSYCNSPDLSQPIDMEIATTESSNSPTFYSNELPAISSLSHMVPILPVPVVCANQVVPIIPKNVDTGIPIGLVNCSIKEEMREKRANTQSPSNLIILTGKGRTESRSRSLDSLDAGTKKETLDEDDEEQALRSLLLSKMNNLPKIQHRRLDQESLSTSAGSLKSVNKLETGNNMTDIESNLRKAAIRIKELSEQETQFIESALDKIIAKPISEPSNESSLRLKEVADRLRLSQAKEKLNEISKFNNELPSQELIDKSCDKLTSDVTKSQSEDVNPQTNLKVVDSNVLPISIPIISNDTVIPNQNISSIEQTEIKVSQTLITPENQDSPKMVNDLQSSVREQITDYSFNEAAKQIKHPINSKQIKKVQSKNSKKLNNVKQILPIKEGLNTIQLKPKQITNAMHTISESHLAKRKPLVGKSKPAPIIMKRKLKTKSSIINVPFHKKPIDTASKLSVNNATSSITSSKLVTSLESVIRPVPKLIIQLGQSSTDESEESSNETDNNDTCNNFPPRSTLASPSHIIEFGDNLELSVNSPQATIKTEALKSSSLPKVDDAFNTRLDKFLKEARAKTEKTVVPASKSTTKHLKTESAVKYLTPSAQVEYKKLLAKIQTLEKQKQAKLKSTNDENVNQKLSTGAEVGPISLSDESKEIKSQQQDVIEKQLEAKEKLLTENSKLFLKELSDFLETIEIATNEKRDQVQMELEIEDLKAKLVNLESKLLSHKQKCNKYHPTIKTKYKHILNSRDKYIKLGKDCSELGKSVSENYQYKGQEQESISEKLKILPVKIQKLVNAKKDFMSELDDKQQPESIREGSGNLHNSYKSVLDCITNNEGISTNGVVCPFQLGGKCSDSECKYIHLP